MAARKLQGEIERTLKKVDEGIDEFNAIWDKVYEAPNQNLKEKHEADLKKEIKKLQRYRDQIKTWASSSDVKDKGPLLNARKNIETQMERFKICEKETKTKAYSKEALQKSKAEDKLSGPKAEMKDWFDEITGTLRDQLKTFESKLEKYGGKKKKKRFDKEEFETLQENVDRHRWHLSKLDLAWQRLESDKITVEMVGEIKDSVEYFVESHADPEFYPDEYMYEPIEEDANPEDFEKKPPSELSDDSPPPSPKHVPPTAPPPEKEVPVARGKKGKKKQVKKVATPAKGKKAATKTPKPKVVKKSTDKSNGETGEKTVVSKKEKKKKVAGKTTKKTVTTTKTTGPAPNFANVLKRNNTTPATGPQQPQVQLPTGPQPVANGPPQQQPTTTAAALLQRQQSGPQQHQHHHQQQQHAPPNGAQQQQPPMVSPYQNALGSPRIQPQPSLALPQHMGPQQGQKHLPPHQQQMQQQMPHSRQGGPQQGPSYAGVHQQNGVPQFPHPGQPMPPQHQLDDHHGHHMHHPQQTAASIVRGTAASTSDGGDGSSIVSTPLSTAVRSMPGSPRPLQTQQLHSQMGPTSLSRASSLTTTGTTGSGGDPSQQQQRGGAVDVSAMQQKFAHAQQQHRHGSSSPMGMPMPSNQQQHPPMSTQGVGVGVGVPGSLSNAQQQQQQQHHAHQRHPAAGGLSPHHGGGAAGPFGGHIGARGGGLVPQGGEKPPLDAQLSQSNLRKFKLLDASFKTRPIARDSESRHRLYVARNPYDSTPKYFPSRPFCGVDDVEIFSKFDIDTLFFIFYFQQGSYQQYVAAKQLKKLSWRYHKKYLTWFQRHDDPTVTNDEFEQGTYVYFDYDSSWCQRVKTDFVFEYKYLEDDLR